ncbi:MAG: tetratricopeptide repeat protein [Armatimonadota bacterium]
MMTRLLVPAGLGLCLIGPASSITAFASPPAQRARQPRTPTAAADISYGQFPDSPLGHFWFYLGQGQQREAQDAFRRISTFEQRYRALTQAVYPSSYPPGTREIVTNCANVALKDEGDPHKRAAIYRVLAQMSYRLKDTDSALANAQRAVRLNPGSPWGWFWLAEIFHDREFYAAEAAARKRELSLFTGNSVDDCLHRSHIYHKLALLYRRYFRQPETAIRYCYLDINEVMKLPDDENYAAYRVGRCSGTFLNILLTMVQDLHDLPRAQRTLEWAAAIIPSFPSEPLYQADILRLGLRLPAAEAAPQ